MKVKSWLALCCLFHSGIKTFVISCLSYIQTSIYMQQSIICLVNPPHYITASDFSFQQLHSCHHSREQREQMRIDLHCRAWVPKQFACSARHKLLRQILYINKICLGRHTVCVSDLTYPRHREKLQHLFRDLSPPL